MISINEIHAKLKGNSQTGFENVARESNKKAVLGALWNSPEMSGYRSTIEKKFGFDIADDKAFPVMESSFSWRKVADKCGSDLSTALREADSASSFAQVLRAGVQSIVNNMYQTVETTFESWTTTVQSNKDTELYAPLHGISFLREIGRQEVYPQARAAGLDIKLKNKKYGVGYAIEKELLEDDQTGQFQRQAGLMGEYAKLALEVLVYAKLASVANAQYADLSVPVSETKPDDEATWPWATSLIGGGATRPSAYGAFNQANIQTGMISLMNQKNKLGLKMSVNPNRLLISPKFRFDAAVLLNSGYYPSVAGSVAGTTGGQFAVNPIQGLASLTVSRFMFDHTGAANGDSSAWYLIDDSKPWFVLQIREAASVSQENPQAGESFDRDVIRFKVSLRANADHIDSRFAWQGNNGSV